MPASLAASMLLWGCGPVAGPGGSTPTVRSTPTAGSTPPAPSGVVATTSATDGVTSLRPRTYLPGDPCDVLTRTTAFPLAPHGCGQEWAALRVTYIPAQDLMDAAAPPRTIRFSQNLQPADAEAAGTAFLRAQAFQQWGETQGEPQVTLALNPSGHSDEVDAAVAAGAHVADVPGCMLPSAIRVTQIGDATTTALRSRGWNAISTTAVVATLPACAGVLLQYGDGHVARLRAVPAPASVVVTGTLQTLAPFGVIWAIDGEAPCGDAAMRSACG